MKKISLSLLTTVFLSVPAFAGFQWVPPQNNQAPRTTEPAVPAEAVIDHIRTGQPLPENSAHSQDNHMMTPMAMEPVSATPEPVISEPIIAPAPISEEPALMPAPADIAPAPSSASAAPQIITPPDAPPLAPSSDAPMSKDVIIGFGDQLPLALALGEIVPKSYHYAFAGGVNPGAFVSWDGQGRSWDLVLSDMLAPHNLSAQMRGNMVMIVQKSSPAQAIPAQNMRVQESSPPIDIIRAPMPPLEPAYTNPPATSSREPFAQNYEPIVLTPKS
jgi:hypothetical protein